LGNLPRGTLGGSRMEIHHKITLPKNWREFFKEYGIIVLGVLTALGGEQAVEAIHHHSEVKEVRAALEEELGWNFTSLKLTIDQMDCVSARLDELDRWSKSWASAPPIKFLRPIGVPNHVAFRSSVWRVSASDAVSRMPLEERIDYAALYDAFDNTKQQHDIQDQAWIDLNMYQQARSLSDNQLIQIAKDIAVIRALDEIMRSNYALMDADARKLHLVASDHPVFKSARSQASAVCEPLLER
jgi:hypothetical protein